VDRLLAVRIAVDPSVETMSETSCFAHSVQQVTDPLRVLKKLRCITREPVLSTVVETLSSYVFHTPSHDIESPLWVVFASGRQLPGMAMGDLK
jgi:hypothetical protein